MNTRKYISALLLAFATVASAQDAWEEWGPTNHEVGHGYIVRAGYTIGGTTPMPLPAEIRKITEFSPKGGATLGIDGYRMFSKRWGASIGAHFFYEGFHTAAEVKSYKMSLTMDGNTMAGYFTGTDVTNTDMWGMLVPVMATFRLSPRWNVSAGPYFGMYFHRNFSGEVYDNGAGVGYLRVDTPTGEKVNIDRSNPATYDFSDNMMTWSGGVEVCFDWKALRHMNVFGKLDWGLNNIWEKDFDAVAFKMFPIYGTVGVAYRY